MLQGHGSVPMYGSSRALDLNQLEQIYSETDGEHIQVSPIPSHHDNDKTEHILLFGSVDARHIIKTAARNWRHDQHKLSFSIFDTQAPLLARQMLLLSLFMDEKDSDMSVQERVETFMEVYGNTFVREKTRQWIKTKANALIRCVTDEKGEMLQYLDFSHLRFKDKDDLEFVFKFWRDEKKKFDSKLFLEERSRRYYGARYDYRKEAIDWDYHMKLRDKASIVYTKEFEKWRLTGIAFEVRESAYDYPNRTLASVEGLKQDGVTVSKWGLFSDIVSGPFYAFGTDSENKIMFKKSNDMHTCTSQEVSEYNLKSYYHEMHHSSLYVKKKESVEKITEIPSDTEHSPDNQPNSNSSIPPLETTDSAIALTSNDATGYRVLDKDHLNITLLPCDPQYVLTKKKAKYEAKFNRIYISNALAQHLPQCAALLSHDPEAAIIVETAKFMLELNAEQCKAFNEKLVEMANDSGFKLASYPNLENKNDLEHLVFKRK